MSLKFAKLHGLGNNYIYLDLVTQQTSFTNWEQLAKAVSDINFGIGSDGLILILPGSNGTDFRMRMFNSDGSEGRMCGNGIRCLAKYVYDNGLTKNECINVDTLAGRLQLSLKVVANRVEQVRVNMGAPRLTRNELPMSIGDPNSQCLNESLEVANQMVHITAVSMGNPHAIIFVDNVQTAPVTTLGPLIENHPAFPDRTNVEFIEVVTPQHLKMRVWERGSGETMACGTGACASTVAAILLNKASRHCQVQLLGGTLDVEWAEDGDVYMTGPATYVADGHFCQQWLENV